MQLLLCRSESDLAAQGALSRHLQDCSACRQVWREAQALNELLAVLPAEAPDQGFTQRVMAEVWQEPPLVSGGGVRPGLRGNLPAGQQRGWVAAFSWGPSAAAQVADWTVAMTTTLAIFSFGLALLPKAQLPGLLTQVAARAAALMGWLLHAGAFILGLTEKLLVLFGAS